MTELQLGNQTIRYDRDATAAIYASLTGGWADECGCVGCRNLMAQRNEIYPLPFRELLERLGIDPNKEAEAVADGPMQNGLHHYGGWFFFVGEMVAEGEGVLLRESPHFTFWATSFGPRPKAWPSVPSLAIAFEAHFKWVLEESFDSRRRIRPNKNDTA